MCVSMDERQSEKKSLGAPAQEIERERERERERQTDRQTDRQKDRETNRRRVKESPKTLSEFTKIE